MDKGFDFGAELVRVSESQNLARRLGANLLGQRVHSWAIKHMASLSTEALRELMAIITEDQ